MHKIGIISGSGDLPLLIGKSLLEKGYNICFFHIKNFANPHVYERYDNSQISLTSFHEIIKDLKNNQIESIIMAGNIKRPSMKDIKFDLTTIKLIKNFLLESKGDDQLLKSISSFFYQNGFPLFDWKIICSELFSLENILTTNKPTKEALKNKDKGLQVFKAIGKSDVGQSLIIQNQLILGIECIEGTDELIKRCGDYKKKGDRGVLLKLSKYNQHSDLDIPTIGINTVKKLIKYNYEGVFLEKNQCIIIDKLNIINYCNSNNLFISTIQKIDQ
jgi:DUF1009 family protein